MVIDMKLIVTLFFVSAATVLTACAEKPSGKVMQSRVSEIEAGMSRDQVISILGSYIRSLSPEELEPICDTFIYNEAIDAKFIHVWYVNGVVDRASDGHDVVCAIVEFEIGSEL